MAVNNFAPAEFGGYVSGVESGGGGGDSSIIEFSGIAINKSYNELVQMVNNGNIVRFNDHFEGEDEPTIDTMCFLTFLMHNTSMYLAIFASFTNDGLLNYNFISNDPDDMMIYD